MPFDRKKFFNIVRPLFGEMTQSQVDGLEVMLQQWESILLQKPDADRRWFGYMLATTHHETAKTMEPIEEYGKGKGRDYGSPDPVTGETYYGRGYVQLTWKENYQKMKDLLGIDFVHKPELALDPVYAFHIMVQGMTRGMFRSPHSLDDYFGPGNDDPYNARDIINGDKGLKPKWSNGVSIGNIIKNYYMTYTKALNTSWYEATPAPKPPEPLPPPPAPEPEPIAPDLKPKLVVVFVPEGVQVEVRTYGPEGNVAK